MAAKKRKKRKWPAVLLGLGFLAVLLPLTFWFAITWFVRATVKGPPPQKPPAAAGERISKEERQQLEGIIRKRDK
jgi:hypothetical protein